MRQFELEKQTTKRGSTVEIWRPAPSSPQTLLGHEVPITRSVLSANEQTMLTVASDEVPRRWRLPARAAVLPKDLVAEARRLAARAPNEEERAAFELSE